MKRFTFIDVQTRPKRETALATNNKQENLCVFIVSDLKLNLKKFIVSDLNLTRKKTARPY
jgi:hypothetical protein